MKSINKNIGDFGENLALELLVNKNHKLLTRNFRRRNGEIDLITTINHILVFTEVKTRYSNKYGYPSEAVNYSKQNTIKKIASSFIYLNNFYDMNVRFDVIEIFLNHYDESYKIIHTEDAFR